MGINKYKEYAKLVRRLKRIVLKSGRKKDFSDNKLRGYIMELMRFDICYNQSYSFNTQMVKLTLRVMISESNRRCL